MSARLSDFLIDEGALPKETVRGAAARQIVYGGALDTALLEMNARAEATLWNELSQASGLPIPDPDLIGGANPSHAGGFDAGRSLRCRAVPVRRDGNRLQLVCGEPIEREALREVSEELAIELDLYIVPEVRLQMARQAVYGQPVPPRFVNLLGRVLGPDSARRWAESHTSAPATSTALATITNGTRDGGAGRGARALVVIGRPVDDTDDLCRVAADAHGAGRTAALRALRGRLEHARVRELTAALRADAASASPERALAAVAAISELRDRLAVPVLIDLVDAKDRDLAEVAREALTEITRQDLGASRRRWRSWLAAHGTEARTDWLFAGLGHKVPEIRFAASEELWQITGQYFGYHFDSPRREREEARDNWRRWWRDHGQNR
jgi:Type II secretion system (T2SS), protein E, N-terminal domain